MRQMLISSLCLWVGAPILAYLEQDDPSKINCHQMIGVYWGAFDPPTTAHEAILCAASKQLRFKKIIIVVNNHGYKNYTNPLDRRIELIRKIICSNCLKDVEVLSQDDANPMDYRVLQQIVDAPLCAISGYDAYHRWVEQSTSAERAQYSAIAVIPRGNQIPILSDLHAFLLPIHADYRHVSSTAVRQQSSVTAPLLKGEGF